MHALVNISFTSYILKPTLISYTDVASSDATNMQATITDDGANNIIINGKKWWTSGAMDPRCEVLIFMGVHVSPETANNSRHNRHSQVLVPMNTPGVKVLRPLTVFGYDDAPHGHAEGTGT